MQVMPVWAHTACAGAGGACAQAPGSGVGQNPGRGWIGIAHNMAAAIHWGLFVINVVSTMLLQTQHKPTGCRDAHSTTA